MEDAVIVAASGGVWIKDAEGNLKVALAGDRLEEGSVLVTVPTRVARVDRGKGLLDEHSLPKGIAGGPGDAPGTEVVNTGCNDSASANLGFDAGADGAAVQGAFRWDLDGLPELTSRDSPVEFVVSSDGYTVMGNDADGERVLTISLVDAEAGDVVVYLSKDVDHPKGGQESDLSLELGYATTDKDGPTVSGTLEVVINDDTPDIGTGAGSFVTFNGEDHQSGSLNYYTGAGMVAETVSFETGAGATTVIVQGKTLYGALGQNIQFTPINGSMPEVASGNNAAGSGTFFAKYEFMGGAGEKSFKIASGPHSYVSLDKFVIDATWGQAYATDSAVAAPEPSSLLLVLMALVGMMRLRVSHQ